MVHMEDLSMRKSRFNGSFPEGGRRRPKDLRDLPRICHAAGDLKGGDDDRRLGIADVSAMKERPIPARRMP